MNLDVPVEVAFEYLVDPRNRPQWQSSLRRIENLSDPTPAVGQTWTDVTALGPRPAMETTALVPSRSWTEVGTWRGISAELTLTFAEREGGCTVTAVMGVRGRGVSRPVGPLLTRLAVLAVPAALKRAAAHLA